MTKITNLPSNSTPDGADIIPTVDASTNTTKKVTFADLFGQGLIGTAGIADDSITFAKITTGMAVQMVSALTSNYATGTTTIPFDDTIPQNTEGTEFMTCAITPKSTTNILRIQANIQCSHTVAAWMIGALFQDTTASAIAVSACYQPTATGMLYMSIDHTMVAGTTASTTFKVRVGSNSAGTLNFNSNTTTRRWGATTKSSIMITEYKAS